MSTKRGRGQRRNRRLKNRSAPLRWIYAEWGPGLVAEMLAWQLAFGRWLMGVA